MGGRILEHESKTIYNEGWNKAKQDTALRMYEKGIKAEDIADMMGDNITLVKQWLSTPIAPMDHSGSLDTTHPSSGTDDCTPIVSSRLVFSIVPNSKSDSTENS